MVSLIEMLEHNLRAIVEDLSRARRSAADLAAATRGNKSMGAQQLSGAAMRLAQVQETMIQDLIDVQSRMSRMGSLGAYSS